MITAVTFSSIGTANGTGWHIVIHGYGFVSVADIANNPSDPSTNPGNNDVGQFSMVLGPSANTPNPNNSSDWAQLGYEDTPTQNNDYYHLDYGTWSSTSITLLGTGSGYTGTPPMSPGSYLNFSVQGSNGRWALWQGAIPSVATTFYEPLPTHSIAGQASQSNLTLPVVTALTLGIQTLSLASASTAQSAITALQIASRRLAYAQAQLGSQQDALLAQQANTQTQAEQLQSSEAALIDINLPHLTQQMSRAQVLQQSGLHVLINERTLRQQAAHILQSMI